MAYDLKVRTRFTVPGVGFNSSGVPVNNKVFVAGELDVTSYTTGGETVNPADLGLTTIDYFGLEVLTVNDAGTEAAAGTMTVAHFIPSTNKVLIHTDVDTEVTSTQDATVRFLAVGDSALTAELT